MYGLELLKPDFLDESLHAGVDRGDVLLHGGVVGKLHAAEMHEIVEHEPRAAYQQQQDNGVVYRTE